LGHTARNANTSIGDGDPHRNTNEHTLPNAGSHQRGGGAYTAYFGYKNDNTGEVTVPVGPNNRFSPAPQDRSQPTTFQSGRQQRSFAVAFNGSNLVWTLKGPNNRGRTATASSGSTHCTTPQAKRRFSTMTA